MSEQLPVPEEPLSVVREEPVIPDALTPTPATAGVQQLIASTQCTLQQPLQSQFADFTATQYLKSNEHLYVKVWPGQY